MPTVTINGQPVEIGEHERLNGIQAARRAGVEIPHYCWHAGLSVVASCRMCLVESGRVDPKTGQLQMQPKLVPACQTPATDGTVFVTDSDKIRAARAMVEEDLLLRHPVDCPICDKAGECQLQDYHFEHGRAERRADIQPFHSRRRSLGDTVTLFVDRCVMCTRCVRFCREISGTAELLVENRGAHEEINVFPGFPLDNKLSGNVTDICPVGALGDKDFLYQQRVWFMKRHPHVCGGCSTGCSIHVEENQDRIYRLKPRENPHVNQWWMCDEGRYGWKYVHAEGRRTMIRRRGRDGELAVLDAGALPERLDADLREGAAPRLAAVLSPFLTVEEAYLLATYVRDIDPGAPLALGPTPTEGDDERFANGFTIRAEKCPNRKGVEEIVAAFTGQVTTLDELLQRDDLESRAIWVAGGYPTPWIDEQRATGLRRARLLVVQDLFESPLWEAADYQLPGAAWYEREGSSVGAGDRLQSFGYAIRPPAGVVVEGRLLWRLLGRTGLYRAAEVREELARAQRYFALATGAIPEHGVDLKAQLLAVSAAGGSERAGA